MKCSLLLLVTVLFLAVEGFPNPAEEIGPKKIVKEGPKKIEGGVRKIAGGGGPEVKKHVHHYKLPGEGGAKKIEAGGPTKIRKEIPGKIRKHVHHYKVGGGGGGKIGGGGGIGVGGGGIGVGGNGGEGGGNNADKVTRDRGKNTRPGGVGCQSGLLTGTARTIDTKVKQLTSGLVNGLGAGKNPNLLNNLLRGVETILDDTVGGLDQAVSDFFCGFNRVFNDIGTDLGQGKLLQAIGSGAITFATGAGSFFGNLGFNAISAVTSGVSKILHGPKKSQ